MTVTTSGATIPTVTPTEPHDPAAPPPGPEGSVELLEDDLLVEDVSIDGMCGVY
jgi:mycofactocin precursor